MKGFKENTKGEIIRLAIDASLDRQNEYFTLYQYHHPLRLYYGAVYDFKDNILALATDVSKYSDAEAYNVANANVLIYDKERKMLIVALNQSNNIKLPEIHALFLNENLKIEKDILLLKDKICDFFSAKLAKFDENSYIYSCVWTNLITVKFNKYNTLKLYEKKLNACIDSVVALLPTPNSITYILSLEVFERKTNSTIKDYCIFTERL